MLVAISDRAERESQQANHRLRQHRRGADQDDHHDPLKRLTSNKRGDHDVGRQRNHSDRHDPADDEDHESVRVIVTSERRTLSKRLSVTRGAAHHARITT